MTVCPHGRLDEKAATLAQLGSGSVGVTVSVSPNRASNDGHDAPASR